MNSSGLISLQSAPASAWLHLVQKCEAYDVYHLPFYHALAQSLGEGEPSLFYFIKNDYLICLPLLIRQIDVLDGLHECGAGYKDATSVYGYAGPVSSRRKIPDEILLDFQRCLTENLRDLKVVTLFSRLHPILENSGIVEGLGHCRHEGFTVSIDTSQSADLQYAEYRRNHKENIQKLEARGFKCRESSSEKDIRAFIEIYDQAMKRVLAPTNYFFPPSWYDSFLRTTDATTRLFICDLDGQPVCGALVALCDGLVELHLAGVSNAYVRLSPLKLLFDHVRQWSVLQQARILHLGGGLGAKADSLFQFKSGFSKRRHLFQTWQWILDRSVHDRLVEAKDRFNQKHKLSTMADFFPRYRAPIFSQYKQGQLRMNDLLTSGCGLSRDADFRMHEDTTPIHVGRGHSGATETSAATPVETTTEATFHCSESKFHILILGGGGHARVIADAILTRAAKRLGLDVVGFLDDDLTLSAQTVLGRPVLGTLADITSVPHDALVIGIGDNELRRRLFEKLSAQGEVFATVIHPHATIARDVKIGKGTVAFAGVVVNTGSVIGDNVILNTGCTVDHDCVVRSHTHICPGAHLGGTVSVGEGAFIGIGSTVIHNKKIGAWATVGGGAAVIRDVLPRTTVVGVPARTLNK